MSDFEIPADDQRPDVTEMVAVHRVFRNAFAMAPQLIGGVADGDLERAGLVGGFYDAVLKFLHAHHSGEDDLLFPKLLERAEDPELVARINGQHELVDHALAVAEATLTEWALDGSATTAARLVGEIETLSAATLPHLDEEEAEILPIVTEHITLTEWQELPGHAMKATDPADLWLILGLVREQMSDEQKARMEEGMPPPLVEGWKSVGLDAYKSKVAALVGAPS